MQKIMFLKPKDNSKNYIVKDLTIKTVKNVQKTFTIFVNLLLECVKTN